MLLNVFSRAAAAIDLVIADPIAFLGHLIDAGKLGFNNFADHILEHLKKDSWNGCSAPWPKSASLCRTTSTCRGF